MPEPLQLHGLDPRESTQEARARGPVTQSSTGEWVVLGHPETVAVATDPQRFSSRVSRFLQLPNGLDGQEHTEVRALVDRYLGHDRMVPLAPVLHEVAASVVAELPRDTTLGAVSDIGAVFAVRAMTRWLGWPSDLEPRLLEWVEANRRASGLGDHDQLARVASDFDEIITSLITPRREDPSINDVTAELVRDTSLGRPLEDAEIVSILRNWTGGDLGSLALCVGVVIHALAGHPELVTRVRQGSDAEVDAILDELLRLDDPFVSNRRITTCPVTLAGQEIPEGARVRIHWTSANLDERVFSPTFDPEAHREDNLVYGIGPHDCPGRELSTLSLRALPQPSSTRWTSIWTATPPERRGRLVAGRSSPCG